ncbi:hypothetical protein X777_11123 [Ooceraea biroi]|uniref:Uncharacterized protein n=1 Tax=Ooceraea biroi TaxID=2015173 RepID=A0A026W4Z9_OOCBI|nr:hypothetical protein X777_11123 [Ooceraea biroi]
MDYDTLTRKAQNKGHMRILLLFTLWNFYIHGTNGIVGYDCGSANLNTTLSLLNVEDCNIPMTEPQVPKTYIQLLQLSKFESIEIKQCKVSINRFMYYCGMHSHISTVQNAQADYILDTTSSQCR